MWLIQFTDFQSNEQLLSHLIHNAQRVINLLKTGEISKIKFGSLNTFCWQIKWNTGILDKDGESYRFKEVILDGKTGKELSSNEFFMNPLSR